LLLVGDEVIPQLLQRPVPEREDKKMVSGVTAGREKEHRDGVIS